MSDSAGIDSAGIDSTGAGDEGRPGLRARTDAQVRAAFERLTGSGAAILQLVVAVTVSYLITHYLLGHQYPIVAVTVTLSSLGQHSAQRAPSSRRVHRTRTPPSSSAKGFGRG